MKNLIKSLSLALLMAIPTYSFSSVVEFKCNNLIKGKLVKRLWAKYDVEKIDLSIKIDPLREDVEMEGELILSNERDHLDLEVYELRSNFSDAETFLLINANSLGSI